MGFSFEIPSFLLSVLAHSDASVFVLLSCCFGIPIFGFIVILLLKPLAKYGKLNTVIIAPIFLTWILSIISTAVLMGIDVEVVKILAAIFSLYVLMVIFCIFNIDLITQYLKHNEKEAKPL